MAKGNELSPYKINLILNHSIILNKVNLKVASVEEDLEKRNEKLISTSEKLKSANGDNSCAAKLRENLEGKAIEDDERIAKLESELVDARKEAEVSDRNYAEVGEQIFSVYSSTYLFLILKKVRAKVRQVEKDLEKGESKAELEETKVSELEEELKIVARNRKSLEESEKKTVSRKEVQRMKMKQLMEDLKKAEEKAQFAEQSVHRVQVEVWKLNIFL